jgi:predicted dehydrogenase
MRFLIVGLGSMGKRRIRNLQYLGFKDIVGCDVDASRRKEVEKSFGVQTCNAVKDGLDENPDAVIISTPPAHHYDIARTVAERRFPFFMEANVIPEGFDKLLAYCEKKKVFVAPSCTMRFQPSIRKIKSLIDAKAIGKVLHFTYHVGQYLPDWHPYEDYRKFYVSKKVTGACREIVPFELNWITWAMGDIALVTGIRRKIAKLQTSIDDIYSMILEFRNGNVGTVVVDVLSRIPYRTLKVVGTEGVLTWEWREKVVNVYTREDEKWREYREPPGIRIPGYVAEEDMYIDEMRAFIDGIRTGTYSHSLKEEGELMKLLIMIEHSSDTMRQLRVRSTKSR